MKYEVKKLKASLAEITIELAGDEVKKEYSAAVRAISKDAEIPGFRKGKAPDKVVVEKYGRYIVEELIEKTLKTKYPEIIEKENIKPITHPKLADAKVTESEIFIKLEVEVLSEIKLGKYKGLEVEKAKAEVKEEQVTEVIEKLASQSGKLKEVAETEAAANGDTVDINFEGFVDGVAFDGGKAEGYDLKLGSKSFIDNFEEQIVGHKKGDEFDVTVSFPAEYHAANLAGKPAVFKIKVNVIKRLELPEVNDDFAKDLGFDDIETLKNEKRRELEEREQAKIEHGFVNTILEKIKAGTELEVPESLIKREIANRISEFEAQLKQQGIPVDTYLKANSMTQEKLEEEIRPIAEEKIKMDLIIDEIARFEGVTVSEEEIEEQAAKIAKHYNTEIEVLKQQLRRVGNYDVFLENVKLEKITQKTIELLVNETIAK